MGGLRPWTPTLPACGEGVDCFGHRWFVSFRVSVMNAFVGRLGLLVFVYLRFFFVFFVVK